MKKIDYTKKLIKVTRAELFYEIKYIIHNQNNVGSGKSGLLFSQRRKDNC